MVITYKYIHAHNMGLMCHSRDAVAFKDNELNYRYFMMNRVDVEVETESSRK